MKTSDIKSSKTSSSVTTKSTLYNNKQQKGGNSMHITKGGLIYIMRTKGRSYWNLSNIPKSKRPKIV